MGLRKISNLINIDNYSEVRPDLMPAPGDLMQMSLLKQVDGIDVYYSTSIDYEKLRNVMREYIHSVVYESEWFDMSSQNGDDSFVIVEHNLGYIPSIVKVYTKFKEGVNEGYIMEGTGSQPGDDDTLNGHHGGLLFAYNENNVKLWAPTLANSINSDPWIIGVVDGWGNDNHNSVSHTASVKVKIWR